MDENKLNPSQIKLNHGNQTKSINQLRRTSEIK